MLKNVQHSKKKFHGCFVDQYNLFLKYKGHLMLHTSNQSEKFFKKVLCI